MKPASIDPPEVWPQLWHDVSGVTGWDVGANCGQTIPVMLEKFDKVVAFEPARECLPYLQELTGNLTVLPCAVSDHDGPVDLIELPGKIDTGQLVSGGTQGMEWDPEHPDAVVRQVIARSIDSLIFTNPGLGVPDFLKIDVEGHELKVLFGAKKLLSINRPRLLIEFHSRDLHTSMRQLLETFGYQCQTVRHPHYTPGSDLWYTHGWIKAAQ